MIDRAELVRWSQIPEAADRYLRPFVCRGALARGGAAIVGTNPATAITPDGVGFDEYMDLLLNLEEFTKFYRHLRIKRGKRATSPTRTGLNGMAKWLSTLGWNCVLDTNVSPYPTASKEDLDLVPPKWQSRWVVVEVVHAVKPRLLILHGEEALKHFAQTLAPQLMVRAQLPFTQLVEQFPRLGGITWEGGEVCEVFVCPHLRFFGHNGGARFLPLCVRSS
ncbi:MAG: hypothetical protein H0T86_08325 [Gemmatimonadales bacterium]|nr:hypothetical protein [Gemmatimonadales bacterium]